MAEGYTALNPTQVLLATLQITVGITKLAASELNLVLTFKKISTNDQSHETISSKVRIKVRKPQECAFPTHHVGASRLGL